jgi:hypothetical protein
MQPNARLRRRRPAQYPLLFVGGDAHAAVAVPSWRCLSGPCLDEVRPISYIVTISGYDDPSNEVAT